MVQAEFNGRVVHNGVKDSSPETSPFSLKAPQKGAGSDSSDEDKEGQIRVGRDYQAVPPPCLPPSERTAHQGEERALLVWAPGVAGDAMEDKELDQFVMTAKEKYGYNMEQALGMVFWHKHDLEGAMLDLANYTPFSEKWNIEDKVMFEQAFQFHGKSFQRIRQMLPDKSVADLVKYYYSWKKTRTRPSLMDRQARKVAEVREEGLFGEENYSEACTNSDEETVGTAGLRQTEDEKPATVAARTKSLPPRGLKISREDLTAFATGEGQEILDELDNDIARCKREVQNNKQLISALHRSNREVDSATFRLEQPEDAVSARWTDQELQLGVQGIRACGQDFMAIAFIIGTKTAAHVETFFNTYKLKFDLDSVCQEGQQGEGE